MTEKKIHILARAVVMSEGHILLAYDPRSKSDHYYDLTKSFYYLPGGHVEFKEAARDGLVREIREETGYASKCGHFLGMLEYAWSFGGDEVCCHTHEINLVFKVDIPGLDYRMTVTQQEDHVAFKWVPLADLAAVTLLPAALKTLLPQWLGNNLNVAFQSSMKS